VKFNVTSFENRDNGDAVLVATRQDFRHADGSEHVVTLTIPKEHRAALLNPSVKPEAHAAHGATPHAAHVPNWQKVPAWKRKPKWQRGK
jgi:hypothetical protein